LVERTVDPLVDDRSLDGARWAEDAFRHFPLEGPLPEEVVVEVEERLLVGHARRPAEIRHLALGQLRLVLPGKQRERSEKAGPLGWHGEKRSAPRAQRQCKLKKCAARSPCCLLR